MLKNEAVLIGKETRKLKINNILDISGGSWFLRRIRQYYIEKYIFNNFKKKKIDIKRTDFSNDVCLKNFRKIGQFDLVFANNLLEHVTNIKSATENISRAVRKGGYLCVSVPHQFPYHPDPIDNMFRPNLKELKALFPNFKIIKGKEIIEKHKFVFTKQSFITLNEVFIQSCLLLKKI